MNPALSADFLQQQTQRLMHSYHHWTGQHLCNADAEPVSQLMSLPFAVASHDTQADPVFNYANHQALTLFKMQPEEMLGLPSRYSAEAMLREARAELMEKVTANGYVEHYSGIRIAKDGSRFMIDDATIWNLLGADEQELMGQAVLIKAWHRL